MKILRACIASLLLLNLVGCDSVETLAPCSDGHCQPPEESVSEISALGVTITPDERPYPDDIETDIYLDEETGKRYVYSSSLEVYFSPALDLGDVENPDSLANDWSDHPYIYTFSKEADGNYGLIKPFIPSNTTLLDGTQFAPLAVTDEPPVLVTFGNHVLEGVSMFPFDATHIEIWYRTEREHEFELMKRITLSDLFAWREFLKPRIDTELAR